MSKLYEDKHAQKHQLPHSDTKSNLPVNAWSKKNMNHKNGHFVQYTLYIGRNGHCYGSCFFCSKHDHFTQYKSKTWLKHEHDHIHDYL